MKMKKLARKARGLEPVMRLGKKGLTENAVAELRRQLRKKKLMRVRLLPSFFENVPKKEVFMRVAESCGGILVDATGFVIALASKKEVKNFKYCGNKKGITNKNPEKRA